MTPDPSPALLAANARLYARRAQLRAERAGAASPPDTAVSPPPPAREEAPTAALRRRVNGLPAHLGWESAAVSAHLRRDGQQGQEGEATPGETAVSPSIPHEATSAPAPSPPSPEPAGAKRPSAPTITLFPDLALALLREEEAAAGRLWLLLRYLDEAGRGWLDRETVTAALTDAASPTYLCSPRHLRRLLKRGNGRFWTIQGDKTGAWRRIWLRSRAKVAAALDVEDVAARPVALPLDVLLGPIGDVRAHFYASFHSSRGDEAGPISRAALAEMSGASPRAQQEYEKRVGVEAEAQFAVGDGETAVSREETAWRRGRATFTLVDVRGQQGHPGRRYLAWRLPNRYRGPRCHRRLPAGRRRRLRRQLAGLRTHGGAGNGRMAARRYFSHARAAVRGARGARARGNGRARYWPLRRPGYLGRRMVGIWLVWTE